jgi:hypothetical protein
MATTWDTGSRVIGTVGIDAGPVRLNGVATTPTGTYASTSTRDKWIGGSLDLGGEQLGLTAEVLGNSDFTFSQFAASRASLRLGAMNILDTGFGLGLGYVSGNVVTMTGPAGGSMTFVNPGTSIFANPHFNSVGAMLKTPSFFIIPAITLAAQQAGGAGGPVSATSAAISSGFTVQTELPLLGLPAFTVEYSRGKFGATGDQSLLGAAAFSHDQVGVATTVRF